MRQELTDIIEKMCGQKIIVAGDLMLDTYIYGEVERISQEGPVPVLAVSREEKMLGGAGNVISNLTTLGAKPVVFTIIGEDRAGDTIREKLGELGLSAEGVLTDGTRPTTLKTRYIARQQQLLRSDIEKTHPLDPKLAALFVNAVEAALPGARAIVLSDYGKGIFTREVLNKIITAARAAGVTVLVDPKGQDYSVYRGADIVTPNRKELAQATRSQNLKSDAEITEAANGIVKDCGIDTVVATRSEDGLSIVTRDAPPVHIATTAQEVFDVSGAGDTVIAALAAALAAGASLEAAGQLANIAAGIAVSKIGTASVTQAEMLDAIHEADHTQGRLASEDEAARQIAKWRARGQKIGFTNGCFDLLHKGHVSYLAEAGKSCDRLVVALNRDASVRLLKGETRPLNDEISRAAVLAALSSVDLVILFGAERPGEDNTPRALIERLKPDIYFKGGDYTLESLPETALIQSYGGEVALMSFHDGYSTTKIITKASSTS